MLKGVKDAQADLSYKPNKKIENTAIERYSL